MQKLDKRQISPHCIMSCIYFLLLPTTIAVNSAGNSILKLATIPIAIFFVVSLFLSDRKLHINGVHLALILFTLSVVVTLFSASDSTSISNVIGYILNAALYICLSIIPYNRDELDLMEKVQIVLLVILNVMTLFFGGAEDDRTTLVIMGQTSDPNFFVGFFIFPLTIAMKQAVSGKHRVPYLILIAVSVYSVFLSGSRGGLLAIAVTVAAFALLYPSNFAKRMLLVIGGFVLLILLWILLKPVLPEKIVERMSIEDVVESGGTGRWYIWKSMIREIIDQPEKLLFGRGIVALHATSIGGVWGNVYAHNQVLQMIYNQGLVGLLSFFALVGICFYRCLKRRRAVSAAMLGMLALSISLSFNQTTRTFWNLVAYAAFAFPDSDINTDDGGLSEDECT